MRVTDVLVVSAGVFEAFQDEYYPIETVETVAKFRNNYAARSAWKMLGQLIFGTWHEKVMTYFRLRVPKLLLHCFRKGPLTRQ